MSNPMATPTNPHILTSPAGDQLSTVGKRLGQYLLEGVLVIVTLGIGYLIWSLVIWSRGQTPGMQCLGMRCVRQDDGTTATWGTMLLREFIGKGLIFSLISVVTFGIGSFILMFMLCWDARRQELWDKIASTLVVDNPR